MVAKKDNRCEKFAFQKSFNNLRDGSQDFTKIMISGPRIETSFINSGSGSQNLKGLKIQCDDKSLWDSSFEDVARSGMDTLFNYNENGSQTFPGSTVLKYLQQTLANKMGGTYPIYSFLSTNISLIYFIYGKNNVFLLYLLPIYILFLIHNLAERKIEIQNPVAILTKLLSSMAYGSNDESLPNNPSPTPNLLRHLSRIVQSFNNSEEGKQDFSHAKIKRTATGDSFNNLGSGSQTFREAQIRCAEESRKPSRSTLPRKGDHLHSFNNKGSQCFNGFKHN